MNDTTTSQRSNATLWLLIAMSIIPFIAAYAYYFYGDFKQFGNNGDLISPVIDLQVLKLNDKNGQKLDHESLTKKWRMLLIVGAECNKDCKTSLYNMRQLNVAVGKHYDRVRHMLIHSEPMNDKFSALIQTEYKEILHGYSTQDILSNILKDVDKNSYSNSIYLMDPIGNIMMRFKLGMDPKIILKDLNRLLKISQIG